MPPFLRTLCPGSPALAHTALDNLSFSLGKNIIAGILGPNGAGKTTLLKIISTLILPDNGEVIVNGYKAGKNDERIKSCVGLVSGDERCFYWRLTGMQNLEFFAAMHGIPPRQARLKIDDLLQRFNITYAHKRFDSYSTGMKRKLAFIRAMLHNPAVLLLDEPSRSLDYAAASELNTFIRNAANQGTTVLYATHALSEAEAVCDTFIILHCGTLRGMGSREELQKKTCSPSGSLSDIYRTLTKND